MCFEKSNIYKSVHSLETFITMAAFVGSSKGKHRKTSLIVQSKVALPSKDFTQLGDDVILTLNVGGEVFQTYQRTLGKKFHTF